MQIHLLTIEENRIVRVLSRQDRTNLLKHDQLVRSPRGAQTSIVNQSLRSSSFQWLDRLLGMHACALVPLITYADLDSLENRINVYV